MEMENTTTIDVLEYAVKMAEKGRNILAQSRDCDNCPYKVRA